MNVERALVLILALWVVGVARGESQTEAPPVPEITSPERPASIRLLYPPSGAVLTSNPAVVMILGPDAADPPGFRLDGEPLAVERIPFAEGWKAVPAKIPLPAGSDNLPLRSPLLEDKDGKVIWAVATDLSDGDHVVTLDGATLASFSFRQPDEADSDTTEPVLRVHGSPSSRADALDCAQCHDAPASEKAAALGIAVTPQACNSCHEEVDLALVHEHVMEFLSKCQMCHDPHAATRPKLLIDTRETVCAMCHESGYAR